jgi:uncharacterized protein (DUF362 family)
MTRRVNCQRIGDDVGKAVAAAFQGAGLDKLLRSNARVAIKPNFTYLYHRPGVTTSPEVLRELVRIIRQATDKIVIVETDGGFGAWKAAEASQGHGLPDLTRQFGVRAVNLNEEPSEAIDVQVRHRRCSPPLPVRLLHETDVFITVPVPELHSMTRVSLALKNQWGCVPGTMRLRRHHLFNEAISAINSALRPVVVGDGTFFLDGNGPMEGTSAGWALSSPQVTRGRSTAMWSRSWASTGAQSAISAAR